MKRNPIQKMSLRDAIMYVKDNLTDEWREFGRHLGLSDADISDIYADHHGNILEVKYQILRKWKSMKGNKATVTALAHALKKSKRSDIAEALIEEENPPDGTAADVQNIPEANRGEYNHPARPAMNSFIMVLVVVCLGVIAYIAVSGSLEVNESKPHIRDEILKRTDDVVELDSIEDAIIYVKDRLTKEWQDVGRNLGLSHADIEHIKEEYDNNPKERNYQMLQKWREQYGRQVTLEALKDALRKAGRRDLAEKLPKGMEKRTKR